MNKEQIIATIEANHQQLANYIEGLTTTEFLQSKNGKWSAGQHASHIVKAISPLAMAFGLPRVVPQLLYGKSNRPSKTYEGLVEKYQQQLAKGGKASGRYVPKEIGLQEKMVLPKQIMHYAQKLNNQVKKMSEPDMDTYILPHPLLGKLTFREMLYFTAYHAVHHHELIKKGLEQ